MLPVQSSESSYFLENKIKCFKTTQYKNLQEFNLLFNGIKNLNLYFLCFYYCILHTRFKISSY